MNELISNHPEHQKTILWVDNDGDITSEVHDYLRKGESSGVQIRQVGTVKEAMLIIEKEEIDLMIIEVLLPVVNGYHLIEWTKEKKPGLPMVVYTRLTGESNMDHLVSSGIKNLFLKQKTKVSSLMSLINQPSFLTEDLTKKLPALKTFLKERGNEKDSQSVKVLTCPRCKVVLNKNSHFCNHCGQKIIKAPVNKK